MPQVQEYAPVTLIGLLQASGKTRAALAAAVGASPAEAGRWIGGKARIPSTKIAAVALFFGVSPTHVILAQENTWAATHAAARDLEAREAREAEERVAR